MDGDRVVENLEPGPDGGRRGRWLRLALTVAVLAVVARPHLVRLKRPSLYGDDVGRVADLRLLDPIDLLLRPLSEHFAPLFGLVDLFAWRAAGGRLVHTPTTFTVASLIPFALCLGTLSWLIRRETGSRAAGRAALVLLGTVSLPIEVAYWYSASTFAWALLGTLLAWAGAASGTAGGLILAVVASALAPGFSTIGVLAGPVASARCFGGLAAASRVTLAGAVRSAVPMLGTLLFVAASMGVRHDRIVSGSLARHFSPSRTAALTIEAPATALLPGLVVPEGVYRRVDPRTGLALGVAFHLAMLAALVRSRRPDLVLPAVLLIDVSYGLAYSVRATFWEREEALYTQRYHLFPLVGLIALLASWAGPRLARLEARRPAVVLAGVLVLAVVLGRCHATALANNAWHYRFPDQPATLAALERVDAICRREGISRDQALAALDPPYVAWLAVPHDTTLRMIDPGIVASRIPDGEVRARILAQLSIDEREAISTGLDVTPWLTDVPKSAAPGPSAPVLRSVGVESGPEPDRVRVVALPALIEFPDIEPGPVTRTDRLVLDVSSEAARPVEVWWSPDGRRWSPTRSVRVRRGRTGGVRTLPLARLPHWDPSRARRFRFVFRETGEYRIAAPRLLGDDPSSPGPRLNPDAR